MKKEYAVVIREPVEMRTSEDEVTDAFAYDNDAIRRDIKHDLMKYGVVSMEKFKELLKPFAADMIDHLFLRLKSIILNGGNRNNSEREDW